MRWYNGFSSGRPKLLKTPLNCPILPETGRAHFNQLYPFRHGSAQILLANRNDNVLTPLIEAYGEFSEGELDVFREVIRPDDVVIEVGANIGVHTLALSELVPRGRVIAFEPQRLIYQVLCANLALNSIINVEPLRMVVGEKVGETALLELDPTTSCNFGNFQVNELWSGADSVMVMALDALSLERLDFIKLDCEGAELNALRGCEATIDRCRPGIYFEFDKNRQELIDFFAPKGYILGRHQPAHAQGARKGQPGYGIASDMVLAWPPDRPCSQAMSNGTFGAKVNFKAASTEDALRTN